MNTKTRGTCQQNACNVAASGKCLENHENPYDCPSFEPETDPEELEEEVETTDDGNKISPTKDVIFPGDEVENGEVDRLLCASFQNVVIVAGSPDSGKTTLFAEIFDAFCEGPFAGYLFAGSETLSGFEKRCFSSRMVSNRSEPTTERTRHEENVRFLHLALNKNNDQASLLLADISGEVFRSMQQDKEEAARHPYLRRANHFALLFDGGKLKDFSLRQEEKASGCSLLRSLVEENLIGKTTSVQIIFSRWDLVQQGSNAGLTETFAQGIRTIIERDFRAAFLDLTFINVAARPTENSLPARHGLADLLQCWADGYPSASKSIDPEILLPGTLHDYFALENAEKISEGNERE